MESIINDVYEVFKEYYGEDRVDLQNNECILVHFPRVTVTNENDQSVEVTDLYIRTKIKFDGTIDGVFDMTRGSYPLSHIYSDYMHSHANGIPREGQFAHCCIGTGPIVHTISLLTQECDLDRWALYCYELDKYTQVESVAGTPYRYLMNISKSSFKTTTVNLSYVELNTYSFFPHKETIKNFIPYLIHKKALDFSVADNHYFIAHPFIEYISILTTAFVEYINEQADEEKNIDYYIRQGFLIKGTYDNGIFSTRQPVTRGSFYNPTGNCCCRFKGHNILVTSENDLINEDDSRDVIIKPDQAKYILYKILSTLNYGKARKQQENLSTEEERAIII